MLGYCISCDNDIASGFDESCIARSREDAHSDLDECICKEICIGVFCTECISRIFTYTREIEEDVTSEPIENQSNESYDCKL